MREISPSRNRAYPALRPDHAASVCGYVCRLIGSTILLDARPASPFCTRTKGAKKRFSSLCARGKRNCLSAISTPRFLFMRSSPGWPASGFASYRRAIIMGHSVWDLFDLMRAGLRRERARRSCQRTTRPCALCLHEENRISTPPVRLAPGIKKRFWCLLGLWPKGTAARHPCVIVRKVIAPHTRAKDGRHFAVRRKTGIFPAKSAFPAYVLAASEIACRQFRRRGFCLCAHPPAGRPRVSRPIAAR